MTIDVSGLDPRLAQTTFILASDVKNPLLGVEGAARVFSPQKGASREEVEILETSLAHFASLADGPHAASPGAGAAGGFGFMAYSFLSATAESGIDLILDLVQFDRQIVGADYIITYVEAGDREYVFVIIADRLKTSSRAEKFARTTVDRILGKIAAPLLPVFPTQPAEVVTEVVVTAS